jgi:hypothetical protein
MADPPRYPEASDDTRRADPGSTGTPRWVKVSGIIAFALILVFVIVMIVGGGNHGPGRHALPAGGPGGPTPSSHITEHSAQEP